MTVRCLDNHQKEEIYELHKEGVSNSNIAEHMQVSERTVRRVIQEVEEFLGGLSVGGTVQFVNRRDNGRLITAVITQFDQHDGGMPVAVERTQERTWPFLSEMLEAKDKQPTTFGDLIREHMEKTSEEKSGISEGDRVKISMTSDFYNLGEEENPRNVVGTVTDTGFGDSLPVLVQWDNGTTNSYNQSDLVEVEAEVGKEFSVGDRVMIAPSSQFHVPDNMANPIGVSGVVVRTGQDSNYGLHIHVDWNNGTSNVYSDEDLILAEDELVQEEEDENIMYTFVAPQDSITIVRIDPDNGIEKRNINRGHMEFDHIRSMIKADQSKVTLAKAYRLMDVAESLEEFSVGRIKVDPNSETVSFVKPDGSVREAPQELTDDIIDTVRTYGKGDSTRLIKFLDKLMDNPSFTSIESLYRFLKNTCIDIDEDGSVIAWKGVRSDLYDRHSGTIYNGNFGEEIRVDRSEVDDNIDRTCSYGLHVGNHSYASGWGSTTLKVRVEPQDVVAVPKDYNGAKMRCCAYTPIQAM